MAEAKTAPIILGILGLGALTGIGIGGWQWYKKVQSNAINWAGAEEQEAIEWAGHTESFSTKHSAAFAVQNLTPRNPLRVERIVDTQGELDEIEWAGHTQTFSRSTKLSSAFSIPRPGFWRPEVDYTEQFG